MTSGLMKGCLTFHACRKLYLSREKVNNFSLQIIEKSISKLNAVTKVLASSETTTVSELMVISDAVVRVTGNSEVLTQNARVTIKVKGNKRK